MKKKKLGIALGASVAASASLLAATSSERYVYDASGNIVEKQIGELVTSFDYTDNLLKGSQSDADQKQYQYDEAGRLVGELKEGQFVRKLNYQFSDKVTKVQIGEKTTELYYNAEGHLVGKSSAGTIEAFAWDGLAMVSRGKETYANEAHVVGGVPALVGSDVVVSDMIGSTLSVGSESFEASAYGEGLESGLFTGKPFVKELDGFVFKYRNYSADESRWLSQDPSGYPDGGNNYAYVNMDPVTKVDPLGLSTWETHAENANLTPGSTWGPTRSTYPRGWSERKGEYKYSWGGDEFNQGVQAGTNPSINYSNSSSITYHGSGSVSLWDTVTVALGAGGGSTTTGGLAIPLSIPDDDAYDWRVRSGKENFTHDEKTRQNRRPAWVSKPQESGHTNQLYWIVEKKEK